MTALTLEQTVASQLRALIEIFHKADDIQVPPAYMDKLDDLASLLEQAGQERLEASEEGRRRWAEVSARMEKICGPEMHLTPLELGSPAEMELTTWHDFGAEMTELLEGDET